MSPSSPIYARSMGPAQLASCIDTRGSLQAPEQPVTFLMEISRELTPEQAARSCDAWEYGCGAEVGIFALLDADDIQVWRDPREDADRHSPVRSPHHVWLQNDTQPLPFERGIYVESPGELATILEASSTEDARARLAELRQNDESAILEAASQRASKLASELEDFGIRQQQLHTLLQNAPEEVSRMLDALGLPDWLLEVHPEHLNRDLRQALDLIHQNARF